MTDPKGGGDGKSLIDSVLAQTRQNAPLNEGDAGGTDLQPPPEAELEDPNVQVGDIIELYFECEEPAERDLLFERLCDLKTPTVDNFLMSMMQEDEDDFARAAAAAELARRGNAEGLAVMEQDLEDPEDQYFFELAATTLAGIRGAPFYDTLKKIWQDDTRDETQRREAMLGMESLDASRALDDFCKFVENCGELETFQDDQLEVAIMAFVRHGHAQARKSLELLQQKARSAQLDPDDQRELVAMLQEGIDLLQA